MDDALERLLQDVDLPPVDDAFVVAVLRKLDAQNRKSIQQRRLLFAAALVGLALGCPMALVQMAPGGGFAEILRIQTVMIQAVTAVGCLGAIARSVRIRVL